MPTVTALRAERRQRVRVELDGAPWRTLPSEAVVAAGLAPGVELDRPRARELRRALRRTGALRRAAGLLSHADRSRAGLDEALARRGVAAPERGAALETMSRLGYLDDARFARSRAERLAERGYGDAAIRFELERQQLDGALAEAALAELAPERERALRAAAGLAPAKAARTLAARGFAADTIEDVVGLPDGE